MDKDNRRKVFISYSQKDKSWLDKLKVHLRPLERDYSFDIWDDTKISVGEDWLSTIENALDSATIAICLVSANFLASDFIANSELPRLLLSAQKNNTTILSIIVSPCMFEESPLSQFQAVNPLHKTLKELNTSERDKVFVKVTRAIKNSIKGKKNRETSKDTKKNTAYNIPKTTKLNKKKTDKNSLFIHYNIEINTLFQKSFEFSTKILSKISKYSWAQDFNTQLLDINYKWKEKRFQVAVIALMKSGKSTLINAWLGDEYLPSASLAETMCIIRINHKTNIDEGVLYGKDNQLISRGALNIRKFLRESNKNARAKDYLTENYEFKLDATFAALSKQSLGEHGFEILDTPGTNENGLDFLAPTVERLLKSVDVIIYLLDYTKLKTNEEAELLSNLANWRKDLSNFSGRIFFVVNKIDMANRHDREQQLQPEDVVEYVLKIIKGQISDIEITSQDIILVSAEKALLARLIQQESATQEQIHDFKVKAFGDIGSKVATIEQCKEVAPTILQSAGLPNLEKNVLAAIYDKRTLIFFDSILGDMERCLTQAVNYLEVSRGALQTEASTIARLKKKIDKIRIDIKEVSSKTNKFKKKEIDQINKSFKDFQKLIDASILAVFEKKEEAVSQNIFSKHITDFLNVTRFDILSDNREETAERVVELNKQIFAIIDLEFSKFWNKVVDRFRASYNTFSEQINNDMQPLIREIEKTINESLNISLRPINKNIPKKNFDDFYTEIERSVNRFVETRKEFNPRFESKTVNHGGINFFGWKILAPGAIELKVPKLFEQKYFVSSQTYRDYLRERLKPITDESVDIATNAIDEQFIKVVELAQSSLEDYSKRYIQVIESEIKGSGGIDVKQRINEINQDIILVDKMVADSAELRKELRN